MHGYSQLIPKFVAKNKMRPEYLDISSYCIIHRKNFHKKLGNCKLQSCIIALFYIEIVKFHIILFPMLHVNFMMKMCQIHHSVVADLEGS